jgi:hypothetical protein
MLQYVVPVTVNCSYCTSDDGCGECPKHVELSCNKTKILLLHLVVYLCTYVENDARNHEPTKITPSVANTFSVIISNVGNYFALNWP